MLPDADVPGGKVDRVVLCCGKMYYDLLDARGQRRRTDVALLRLEQFYPFPDAQLAGLLRKYPEGTPVYWVQEEPENMGVIPFLRGRLCDKLFGRYPVRWISRPPSASPATGSASSHRLEQKELIAKTFGEV